MILLIDNYDSFTYNLVQRIGELDPAIDLHVVRNDKITVEEAAALNPSHLIISPGPCTPKESGISGDLIQHFLGRIPILGVCLGHQTIADRFGMTVHRHTILMHGKTSQIHHDGKTIFAGLPNPFTATRYHSLIVDRNTLSNEFEVSAWTEAGEIMGLRWTGATTLRAVTPDATGTTTLRAVNPDAKGRPASIEQPKAICQKPKAPLEGVQFHPESFLTTEGPQLLANFLGRAGVRC